MRKTINTNNATELFEKIKSDEMFIVKEDEFGLTARYNGVFGLLESPRIRATKLNEKSAQIIISPSILLIITSTFFTLFFWAIALLGIILNKLNIPIIIGVFLLPSIMWVLGIISSRKINKMILDEFEKYDY